MTTATYTEGRKAVAPSTPLKVRQARLAIRSGALIVLGLVFLAVFAGVIAPHNPDAIDPRAVFASPSLNHLFGGDDFGRDTFSRVLYAFRVSLGIAAGSVLLACIVGIPIGLAAGYIGTWVDMTLMRGVDLFLAFPALLLAISLIAIFGAGELVALVAIAVIYIPIMARVVRNSVLNVRDQPYVLGARARGASHVRVLVAHVMPNAMGPALVQASLMMAFAIVIEAALSFLGLGTQPPTPELGLMLADGQNYLTQAPWMEIFPGLALAIAVFAFNLIGDGIRRHFDPND
jgi:peptide/nickel transport system permease protein